MSVESGYPDLLKGSCWALSIVLALTVKTVGAESALGDDYRTLVAHQKEIENHVAELRNSLSSLEENTFKLEREWNVCSNQKWRVLWQTTVSEAEQQRANLEKERKSIVTLDKELEDNNFRYEQVRKHIETNFPAGGSGYEDAFRAYMHDLEDRYISPMENTYVHSIEQYISGVVSYQSFINYSMQACKRGDWSTPAFDTAGKYLGEILYALGTIRSILDSRKVA